MNHEILTEEWVVWMSNQDIARLTKREPDAANSSLGARAITGSVVAQLAVTNPNPRAEMTG